MELRWWTGGKGPAEAAGDQCADQSREEEIRGGAEKWMRQAAAEQHGSHEVSIVEHPGKGKEYQSCGPEKAHSRREGENRHSS